MSALARWRRPEAPGLVTDLVGPSLATLPRIVRRFHAGAGDVDGRGIFHVEQAPTRRGRLLARVMGLPRVRGDVLVTVEIERTGTTTERWRREFAGEAMCSVQTTDGSYLVERVGPFELRFVVTAAGGCLRFTHVRTDLCLGPHRWGVPRWAGPVVEARVGSADRRRLDVEVAICSPLVGLLFAYRGRLHPEVT